MPCLAKKYEAMRLELVSENQKKSVDSVISTREMASMIREAGLNFIELPDEEYDQFMGESIGASVIFGVTGGVLKTVLRTAV